MTSLDPVRAVADAVLYEGYVLYPYRASSRKNQSRWQFGVLMPADFAAVDDSEASVQQTECLADHGDGTVFEVLVRFLRVLRRAEPGRAAWDEAAEHEVRLVATADQLLGSGVRVPLRLDGSEASDGDVVRRMEPVEGVVTLSAAALDGPSRTLRLRLRVENSTPLDPVPARRDDALPYAFVAVHAILTVRGGRFLSMVDPPEWATSAVAGCRNTGTWPVLAGDAVLSSPIILYDHPTLAPESPGDLHDGLEIDEILILRTLALTDAEKAEARATDPRAAAIIDRVDSMDAATMDRLHGAIRTLRPEARRAPRAQDYGPVSEDPFAGWDELVATGRAAPLDKPWWDPGADASVSPSTDSVTVAGVAVARGSRVRLVPGAKRADAQDMFLIGRTATVEAVLFDVDNGGYLAVTLDDDDNADLQRAHGRFLYFSPDEVEPA